MGTGLFGCGEAGLLGQRIRALLASFLGKPTNRVSNQSTVHVQGSLNWNKLWCGVKELSEPLNLKTIRLDLNVPALHEGYHACWEHWTREVEERIVWRAEIPLEVHHQVIGRLEVVGYHDDQPFGQKILTLAKFVHGFETTATILTHDAWESTCPEPAQIPNKRKEDEVFVP